MNDSRHASAAASFVLSEEYMIWKLEMSPFRRADLPQS